MVKANYPAPFKKCEYSIPVVINSFGKHPHPHHDKGTCLLNSPFSGLTISLRLDGLALVSSIPIGTDYTTKEDNVQKKVN
jgi:hypothetical protein